jgi:hypothetical protein
MTRPDGDPKPLPYLDSPSDRDSGAVDVEQEIWLQTAAIARAGDAPHLLARSNYAEASYWSLAQRVAHHTINGCNLNSGDLLGTGTLSGPKPDQAASLMELTVNGKEPVSLPNSETRGLDDGDTIILKGWCHRPGRQRIGFGEFRGTVLPARPGSLGKSDSQLMPSASPQGARGGPTCQKPQERLHLSDPSSLSWVAFHPECPVRLSGSTVSSWPKVLSVPPGSCSR